MFAEEGVNGAHQDPQYNVLYRNINMYRSFVDAAVAKHVMASVRMAQIDGAHNANATALEASSWPGGRLMGRVSPRIATRARRRCYTPRVPAASSGGVA